jgi:K+-transporting ATPase c subunit
MTGQQARNRANLGPALAVVRDGAPVKKYTFGRPLGFLGESGVHVLLLNIALDKQHPVP